LVVCRSRLSPALTLTGRVAVVTGGSGNIGSAIARKFAACGMKVAILCDAEGSAQNAARTIAAENGEALGVQGDVTDVSSVESGLGVVADAFGGIDVVVNCAGILDLSKIPDLSPDQWDKVMAVNLRGTFTVTQRALPFLEKSRAPRVINISSNSGRMGGFENGMAYSASKGGVIALTYGMARQLAGKGITVNCIAPGTIESAMSRARDPAAIARLLQRFPIGRFGTADEVAAAACYFASEEAAFTTGAVLDVNGGLFMG